MGAGKLSPIGPPKAAPQRPLGFRGLNALRAGVYAAAGLAALGAVLVGAAWAGLFDKQLGGAFTGKPADAAHLVAAARKLIEDAYRGIDPARIADHHVHLVGLGAGGTGVFVHPGMRSPLDPQRYARARLYLSAAAVTDDAHADEQYVARLVDLVSHLPAPGRHFLLAFDKRYLVDGTPDLTRTEFYVPDDYVFAVAAAHPNLFAPALSVHPYRTDALEALARGAARGSRMVKWLPAAMGIDPADPRCDAYYDKLRELGLVLLTHAGDEMAVHADEDQALGNPLRLRRALDRGVKVLVAHAASLGESEDTDDPARARVSSFRLFLRLMDDPGYAGLVFGEISALTQYNRLGEPLLTLLDRPDLHARLVDGSDYPLPAVNAVIHTRKLLAEGYITAEEREGLNAIYDVNPLLFDFVLKRTLRHPKTGKRFAASVFMENPALGL